MLGHDCHPLLTSWVPPLTFAFIYSYFDRNVFFFTPFSQNSCHLTWDWECDPEFEGKLHAYSQYSQRSINWVDWLGNSAGVGTGVAVLELSKDEIDRICHGDRLGDPATLRFRDPVNFRAGEVHNCYHQWQDIIGVSLSPQQIQVLKWIKDKLSIFEYFQPFSGSFKGKQYSSDYPPSEHFRNNTSCKPFADFVRSTLLDRLTSGAIPLKGKVGEVEPPYLVLPLTVEPTKPRLCHDRFRESKSFP